MKTKKKKILKKILNIPRYLFFSIFKKKRDEAVKEYIEKMINFYKIEDDEFKVNLIFYLDLSEDKSIRIDLSETYYNFYEKYPADLKDLSYIFYFIRNKWGENYVNFLKNFI